MKLSIKIEDYEESKTKLSFSLVNEERRPVLLSKLCFTMVNAVSKKTLENAELILQTGSYVEIKPIGDMLFEKGNIWYFTMIIDAVIKQYTDMPAGVFAVEGDEVIAVKYSTADKIAARGIEVETLNIAEYSPQISRKLNCFPLPQEVDFSNEFIDLSGGFMVNSDAEFDQSFEHAVEIESDFSGDINLFKNSAIGMPLRLILDTTLRSNAYELDIKSESVELVASEMGGIHNGLMSLWQMAALNPKRVACVEITDAPRFEWRGQHLDTARQFFSVDEIKRFINHMGLYKLNKFHWHLVDDEAWRIEIKTLPELTAKLATRGYGQLVEPAFGSAAAAEGGYYSHDDMRDIVAYAAKRNIEVIPEVDIPGHCYAAIKALPELLEVEDQSEYASVQNYKNNCLNPALPETYDFIERVFAEISQIFPSDFIHIGADERPHGSWEKSPKIAELMAQNGYNSTEQVQTHFLNKVQDIATKYGKKTGAWEEATEQGDIGKDGYVVSWKGVEAGIDAAERGYNVVMSPAQYCYLDMAQSPHFDEAGLTWIGDWVPMQKTYSYDPIPADTPADVAARFKGIQGCLWSENLYDKSIVDQMVFPRLIALSEICWVDAKDKDFAAFRQDLKNFHQPMLDALYIKYRSRDFD